jgi:DNA-directed RNA polymerase specialized sigma24 family protein
MSSNGSVTVWLNQLKGGDAEAAQRLWASYFPRLVRLARKKLRALPRRAADEEDVALSAFDSFCRGAEQGRFPRLADRNNLWHLLMVVTARKAHKLIRREGRQKRGGGAVRGDSAFRGAAGESDDAGLDGLIGPEPTPEFAARVAEEYQQLLRRLGDDDLRRVAVWKMEGYSNEDIAARLGCVPRTVERKLALIRSLWGQAPA